MEPEIRTQAKELRTKGDLLLQEQGLSEARKAWLEARRLERDAALTARKRRLGLVDA